MSRLLIYCIMLILCAGCATRYPMGLTRDQWDALTPDQQAEYQARQYELDQRHRMQLAAEQAERERIRHEQIAAERERLAELYTNARYGDIVRVSLQGGSVEYYGNRYPYQPVAFEIARGEAKVINVVRSGQIQQSVPFRVRLSQDGQSFFFNEGSHRQEVLVNRDWERGQSYTLSNAEIKGTFGLPGASVFIKYQDLPGSPERVVIEHR